MSTSGVPRVVALEEHLATTDVLAAWRRHDPDPRELTTRWISGIADQLTDTGDGRLADMDAAGVDAAVLSLTTPGLQDLDPADAVALQGPTNDVIADAVHRHPDRFGGFAALATPDPAAAARELERAVVGLGLDGAMLHSLSGGGFLDAPRYWEIYEAAESLRAPIYLHPSVPPVAVHDAYYAGLGELPSGLLATGTPGWHYQTGIALLRLVVAGVFDRFPHLQVVVGHWGEMVLFYLDRIAELDRVAHLDRAVVDYVRENVFVTGSGIASHRALRWTLEVVGAERVMSATDHPFNTARAGAARRFLAEADLTEEAWERIGWRNWAELRAGIRR